MLCRIAGHFPQIGEYTSGQEVGADKVRRTVMGAFLVVAADITVLLALVRLVSLLQISERERADSGCVVSGYRITDNKWN